MKFQIIIVIMKRSIITIKKQVRVYYMSYIQLQSIMIYKYHRTKGEKQWIKKLLYNIKLLYNLIELILEMMDNL